MSDSVEKNRRMVIAELFHAGRKASEIIRDTGYAPRTVYRILSNLREGKGILRKAYSPKSDKIRTKRFLCGLKRSIAANPSQINGTAGKETECHQNDHFKSRKERSWDEIILQMAS